MIAEGLTFQMVYQVINLDIVSFRQKSTEKFTGKVY